MNTLTLRQSIAGRRAIARVCALFTVVFAASGCSVVPDWSRRESREVIVEVHYEGTDAPRQVPLPTSSPEVMVLELSAEPGGLEESYSATTRHLHLPAGNGRTCVRCRLLLFREPTDVPGPRAWPPARALFPGAARVVELN